MRSLIRQKVGRGGKSFLVDYPDHRADDVDIRIKHTRAACSKVAGKLKSKLDLGGKVVCSTEIRAGFFVEAGVRIRVVSWN